MLGRVALELKMAVCLNEVNLIGELANDPDIRQMGDGRSVCNLRVLTTSTWRDRNSAEEKTRKKYTTVVLFSKDAVADAQGLRTGARVTVRGELQDRKWQDQDKWVTEVVVQGLTHLFIPHNARTQPSENRSSSPQRGQISGQPLAKKSFPGRQSHANDFDLDDSVPWLDGPD